MVLSPGRFSDRAQGTDEREGLEANGAMCALSLSHVTPNRFSVKWNQRLAEKRWPDPRTRPGSLEHAVGKFDRISAWKVIAVPVETTAQKASAGSGAVVASDDLVFGFDPRFGVGPFAATAVFAVISAQSERPSAVP